MADELRGIQGGNGKPFPHPQTAIFMGESESPTSWSFSADSGADLTEAITLDLGGASDGSALPTIVANVLGYPVRRGVNNIDRHLPFVHPIWTDCVVTSISDIRGIGYVDKGKFGYGNYRRWRATLKYAKPIYPLPDPEGTVTEAARKAYFLWETSPTQDIITRKATGAQFIFTEGADVGKALGIDPAIRLARATTQVTHFALPQDSIYDSDSFPSLIAEALGRINNDAVIMGKAAGTLLFQPPRIRRYLSGVSNIIMQQSPYPSFLYDVTYLLSYAEFGWNKFPDSTNTFSTALLGGVGGPALYGTAPFGDVIGVTL